MPYLTNHALRKFSTIAFLPNASAVKKEKCYTRSSLPFGPLRTSIGIRSLLYVQRNLPGKCRSCCKQSVRRLAQMTERCFIFVQILPHTIGHGTHCTTKLQKRGEPIRHTGKRLRTDSPCRLLSRLNQLFRNHLAA